ncbi:MAG: hypothetical protein PPP55_02160 [Halorubrum sp.]
MAITENDELYHAVCRECTAERVFDTAAGADEFATHHADETGHPIVVERVD